jgi:transcriptional antiterminator NusG
MRRPAKLLGSAVARSTPSLDGYRIARNEEENVSMDEESKGSPTKKNHQIFRLGDTVRIVSGPFVSFTGKIEGINQAKALLKVKVAIYGRNKPIKLSFADVEILSVT